MATFSRELIISNLPHGITAGILLDALEAGAPFQDQVFGVGVMPRIRAENGIDDDPSPCWARLEMWTSRGAIRVLQFINEGKLKIDGLVVRCKFDSVRRDSFFTELSRKEIGHASRVLVLDGDPRTVGHENLKDYVRELTKGLWFDCQSMKEYVHGSQHLVIWQFADYPSAESAHTRLQTELRERRVMMSLGHGHDSFAMGRDKALKWNLDRRNWKGFRSESEVRYSATRQVRARRKWIHRNFKNGQRIKLDRGSGEGETSQAKDKDAFWPGMPDPSSEE